MTVGILPGPSLFLFSATHLFFFFPDSTSPLFPSVLVPAISFPLSGVHTGSIFPGCRNSPQDLVLDSSCISLFLSDCQTSLYDVTSGRSGFNFLFWTCHPWPFPSQPSDISTPSFLYSTFGSRWQESSLLPWPSGIFASIFFPPVGHLCRFSFSFLFPTGGILHHRASLLILLFVHSTLFLDSPWPWLFLLWSCFSSFPTVKLLCRIFSWNPTLVFIPHRWMWFMISVYGHLGLAVISVVP